MSAEDYNNNASTTVQVEEEPTIRTSRFGSFLHDLIFVCCGTSKRNPDLITVINKFQLNSSLPVGAAYLFFLVVGVPVAMIYVGASRIEDCPVQPMLPVYLFITGAFSVFRSFWYFLEFWISRRKIGFVFYKFADNVVVMLTAFMATWYMFGLYWTLHVFWPNLESPSSTQYCDPAVYLIAFVTVIGILIILVFWCTCICFLAFQVVPVVNERISEMGIPVSVPPRVYVMEAPRQTTIIEMA